jgi:drug/metabolite transporter (DMT)-like permease
MSDLTPTHLPTLVPSALAGNLTCALGMMFFAIGFPAAEHLLQNWGVLALIAARNIIGLVAVLMIWLAWEGRDGFKGIPWLKAAMIGGIGFGAGSTLLLLAQSMTNAVTAALIASSMPVVAVGIEVLLDGRRLTRWFVLGLGLVVVGGVYAAGVGIGKAEFGFGVLVGLAATVFYSLGSRGAVKSLPGMSAMGQTGATLVGMAGFSAIVYAGAAVMGHASAEVQGVFDMTEVAVMAVYALIGLAVSQVLWIVAVRNIGVGIASFHVNAVPFYVMVTVVLAGGLWVNQQFIGALIVVFGVLLSQMRGRQSSAS